MPRWRAREGARQGQKKDQQDTVSLEAAVTSRAERDRLWRKLDRNGGGTLSFGELESGMYATCPREFAPAQKKRNKIIFLKAMQTADLDGGGLVSRDEFRLLVSTTAANLGRAEQRAHAEAGLWRGGWAPKIGCSVVGLTERDATGGGAVGSPARRSFT
jgi:hypothetical protein